MDYEQYKALRLQGYSPEDIEAGNTPKPVTYGVPIEKPTRGWKGQILPTAGAILGGLGGAIAGTAVGTPLGGYAGGVAGSAAGGALGETLQQGIEKFTGVREEIAPSEIAKTGLEFGAFEAIGGPLLSAGGKVLKGAGKTIAKAVLPVSAKEAILLQTYQAGVPFWQRVLTGVGVETGKKAPTTVAETAFKKGLVGTESMIGVQAKKASNNLWKNLVAPALEKTPVKVSLPTFFKELEQGIIAKTPEKARQGELLTALKALKSSYKGIKNVTLKELQQFKEGWAKFVPEKAYRGKPIAGVFNDVQNEASSLARDKIYNALGEEVKQAYFDYGNLKGLQELGQRAMTGGKLKGGFGSFWSAIKDMALTPAGTIGGQTLYKVGRGVELFGQPGAKAVRDIIPGVAGIGEEINPSSEPSR